MYVIKVVTGLFADMPICRLMIRRQDNLQTQFTDKTIRGQDVYWTCQFADCGQFADKTNRGQGV